MKTVKIISGIAFVIGLFLIFCVAGADDYYMEIGVPHATNIVLAFVGLALMIPFPVILNSRKGRRNE